MSGRHTHIRTRAIRHMVHARRKFASGPIKALSFVDPVAAATHERVERIERLLREGRDAEAILLANVGAWSDQTCADRLRKANFNPDEPRDEGERREADHGAAAERRRAPTARRGRWRRRRLDVHVTRCRHLSRLNDKPTANVPKKRRRAASREGARPSPRHDRRRRTSARPSSAPSRRRWRSARASR